MSELPLTAEQEAEAQRIRETIAARVQQEVEQISRLLASKPDCELLGETEFELRDIVHRIGACALEAALTERKKGGYLGSSTGCPHCKESAKFVNDRPKTFFSLLGPIRIPRRGAFVVCKFFCHQFFCPMSDAGFVRANKRERAVVLDVSS
jgi:hypothetical protein